MWHWRSGAFDVVVWPLNNAFQLLHEKNASTTGWSHCLYRRRIMTIFISRVVQRKTCEKCASLNRAIINFSLAPHCCHTVCPFFLRTPLDTLNEMGWDEMRMRQTDSSLLCPYRLTPQSLCLIVVLSIILFCGGAPLSDKFEILRGIMCLRGPEGRSD